MIFVRFVLLRMRRCFQTHGSLNTSGDSLLFTFRQDGIHKKIPCNTSLQGIRL